MGGECKTRYKVILSHFLYSSSPFPFFRVIKSTSLLFAILAYVITTYNVRAKSTPIHDLVVYGGSSAVVITKIQTKKIGKSVVLVRPGIHLIRLSSGELCTDGYVILSMLLNSYRLKTKYHLTGYPTILSSPVK